MPGFGGIGKVLIIIGIVIAVIGVLLTFGTRIPFLGKLPGDILIRKDGVSFYLHGCPVAGILPEKRRDFYRYTHRTSLSILYLPPIRNTPYTFEIWMVIIRV